MRRGGGFPALLLVVIALGGFGALLMRNTQPAAEIRVIVPTEIPPSATVNAWQAVLAAGFGSGTTPIPTVALPTEIFVPPTLAVSGDTARTALAPGELGGDAVPTLVPFSDAATPTPPPPTSALLATVIPVTAEYVTRAPIDWQPPPLLPPLSRDPLGRDHYWFIRPVDSNANNQGLYYYPYGSDGADDAYRVHAGIDMPNPIGETVRAAGSGVVVWARDGLRTESGSFQNTYSYGNVVVVAHDFGYRGRPLYTLYAHLSAVLVIEGQGVRAGDPIGLVGNTGRVTGPHVHFEVRLGDAGSGEVPGYGETYNPVLWMVPYVGTGVIAGRVVDSVGDSLMDVDITIRDWGRGIVADTTTTYIYAGAGVDINADPSWEENFVVSDLPAGRYEVIANLDGMRIPQIVTVIEGTTTFVELTP